MFQKNTYTNECCTIVNNTAFTCYDDCLHTKMCIVNILSSSKVPVTIGIDVHELIKSQCDLCPQDTSCKPPIRLTSNPAPDFNNFRDIAIPEITKSLDYWQIKKNELTDVDIKVLMALMCIFYGVDEEKIAQISQIELTSFFINDIKNCDFKNLKEIAFSIFRAACYPSAQDQRNRHALSIDWHKNNPSTIDNYNLFRIDVVAPKKTGIRASGKSRSLMTRVNNKIIFFYHTDNHDFCTRTIKQRLTAYKTQ